MAVDAQIQLSTYAAEHAVAVDPYAIGYVSSSQIKPEVKAISINGVSLTDQSVMSGNYAIIRPLLFLVNGEPQEE